ncbi:retrovirus-related pol polyprotein from transposon TNT 1-94 [Tanacetum coccineum]
MHNNIMAAGSKDRPPMLGPGRYSQWRSRFLRYIDTKPNGEGLRKSILSGPYVPSTVLVQAVAATEGNPAIQQHTTIETVLNMTPENKEHFLSEKEAIFLLLTGIGDDIYSTVDACKTANEMWIAIERLQQGESLNVQDVKTNLFWEFGKFTSRDGESMESYYSRFYKLMNELTRNNLQVTTMQVNVQFLQQLQPEWSRFVTVVKQSKEIDTISYHTLFDILKQYQNEVNDIRAERIAKSANPLALLAAAQPYSDNYYQAPKPQRSNATSSSTRPSASTRHKGKEIAKPVTPQSESVSEEDSDPEQAQRDKDMQKNLTLLAMTTTVAGTRETVGSPVVQQTGIQCFNCKGFGHYAKECRKPKRVKDYSYHKEKMMMCKQAEQGVPLQAEQADWLEDTDEEIDEQELEAHYSYMAKIQEVSPEESSSTGQPLEQVQNNDENNVFANERQHSKNNTAECADERAALANLIANLTLDTEENKTILKQLKKANASLTQELEKCKTNLDETSRALGEATSCRDSCLIALQNKQNEFEKYKAFNDRTIDYEILQTKLNETLGLLALKDIEIKEGLKTKAYEISVLNQKHNELVKKSLLTKSQLEGYLKEKTKYLKDVNARTKKLSSFEIDHFAPIPCYGDLIQGNVMIKRVIYVEGPITIFPSVESILVMRIWRVTEFLNKTLHAYIKEEDMHINQYSTPRTPEQNSDVEIRNALLFRLPNDARASITSIIIWAEAASFLKTKGGQIMTTSYPSTPRQNVVPTAEKTDLSQQGLEFLFSPLLEEYYNLTHGHTEDNNNDQAPKCNHFKKQNLSIL